MQLGPRLACPKAQKAEFWRKPPLAGSNQWPGVRTTRAGLGKMACLQEALQPPPHGTDLSVAEQGSELRLQGATGRELLAQGLQILGQIFGDRLTDEVPYHRAQFVFFVKAYTVVDQPNPLPCSKEDVTPLAIRIVDHHIEKRRGSQQLLLLVAHIEIMALWVGLHEKLQGTSPSGTVLTQHRWWDKVPTERPAGQVGSHFTVGKRLAGKVPQGPLTLKWLVHRADAVVLRANLHQKGVIRAPYELPGNLDAALREGLEHLLGRAMAIHTGDDLAGSG